MGSKDAQRGDKMGKLMDTVTKFPQTEIWNDSCSCNELNYALNLGATGATTNPVIVKNVLKNELPQWESTIIDILEKNVTYTEDKVAWEVIKKMGYKASLLMLDRFRESHGQKGRISFQTNAKYYRDANAMVEHAIELAAVCPNSQIKAPASKAGIEAYEEMTFRGISINATVSFTVAQAIATAEAVEKGLKRREAAGLDTSEMHPVCTIMAGRLDDYLKKEADCLGIEENREYLDWAGVAVVKEAYRIYKERGYRTKLLVAAFRNIHHWVEMIGCDVVLTMTHGWQEKFEDSKEIVIDHSTIQVEKEKIEYLRQFKEFNQAYDEKGMSLDDFEHFGPFVVTMNQFLEGYDELVKLIRNYMVK